MLAAGLAGILSSVAGLLMLTPFLVLLVPMLAGYFAGEATLQSLVRIAARRRRYPAEAAEGHLVILAWKPLAGRAHGPTGPRAPPLQPA